MPSDDSAPHPLGYYRGVLRTPREPLGCRVRSLSTEILRYQGKASRIYLRAAAEAERIKYAIRLPANQILQHRIGYLLKRPVGRPSNEVRRFHANFTYQAGSWTKPRGFRMLLRKFSLTWKMVISFLSIRAMYQRWVAM